ncbi:MAG: magnesium transporter CorA family protein [Lentisphaeria bacterium]|jgi:magnesium transporter
MLKRHELLDGRLVETGDEQSPILVYLNPDETERRYLTSELKLDEHTLNSALDPDELSRLEFEPDHVAAIFKRPKYYCADDNFLFRVSSAGAFLFKNRLVLVLSEDVPLFDGGKSFLRLQSLNEVFLKIIYRSIFHFLEHLKVINLIVDQLEQKLPSAMGNKHLLNLFTLEKSLVYYLNAINSNGMLIEKLRTAAGKIGFSAEQVEFLEDMTIENTQCFKQADIYSSILASMMDARASVINNNLNILMKRLTVLSLVFLPINIIASIGGMSEYSQWTHGVHWSISYSLFGLAMMVIGWLTYLIFRWSGLDQPAD